VYKVLTRVGNLIAEMAVSHLLELWSFLSRRGKRYDHVGYRVTVAVYSSTCLFGTRKLLYRYLERIVLIRSVNEPANADLQVLYLWRANFGQQKFSWEADIRSVSHNIICLVWKSKTNFPVHKFLLLDHTRSQLNPFYTFTFHNLKVHINIILLPMPRSRNGLFFSRLPFQFLCTWHLCCAHCLLHLIFLHLNSHPSLFDRSHQLWSL
jgi:hypothetical protein